MGTTMRALVLILAGGVIAGCEQRAPESVAAPEWESATVISPEQSAGAVVEVDEANVFFFHFDAERGLLSAHLPSDFCLGEPLNVADRQIITTPSEIQQRIVQISDADSRVAVYRASSLADLTSDFCGFLLGPTKVAEGTVRHTQTLSNASFASRWTGTIEAVGGGRLHLTEVFQLTADAHDPNNPATWSVNASRILLSAR